ncbi:hypothetical protein FHS57_006304, partial [Runella defluvii]|nr:hypothetical protein [Runella defluvii]
GLQNFNDHISMNECTNLFDTKNILNFIAHNNLHLPKLN